MIERTTRDHGASMLYSYYVHIISNYPPGHDHMRVSQMSGGWAVLSNRTSLQ